MRMCRLGTFNKSRTGGMNTGCQMLVDFHISFESVLHSSLQFKLNILNVIREHLELSFAIAHEPLRRKAMGSLQFPLSRTTVSLPCERRWGGSPKLVFMTGSRLLLC
jgi:hypothetical protein